MDENERITLRLEKENLELIDEFLKGSTSHGNRSQLVRDAVQAYIQTIREGGDTVRGGSGALLPAIRSSGVESPLEGGPC